ncbi:MAG: hypothetical protein JO359_09810 [Candidatus Eremiobacteraeota bacterium]|nr:hypothetical protein [Candidatus Eremiobacteraeota bacterium]
MPRLVTALLAVALLGAGGHPPWLRPPAGWVLVENPPNYGTLKILAMWKEAKEEDGPQNISLGVQPYAGRLASYVAATKRMLYAGTQPTLYSEKPFACASGPARLLVYESSAFGTAAHFEQLLVQRTTDVYVATYTRRMTQPQDAAAASALRSICR